VILFALVLGFVCSILLVGVSLYTAPFKEANEEAEQVKNFLSVLEVPMDPLAGSEELLGIFERNVRSRTVGELVLYDYIPETSAAGVPAAGVPARVAVLFSGAGLWGPIEGVLALEPDLRTIRGIRFYQQEETPGLGGEIGAQWFQRQFVGKLLVSSSGEPGFKVVKTGGDSDANAVDGITGATMTSARVGTMLDSLAKELEEARD
jgi:Na+-transporting NADH:ubiquinone oxidoreductase subunit C